MLMLQSARLSQEIRLGEKLLSSLQLAEIVEEPGAQFIGVLRDRVPAGPDADDVILPQIDGLLSPLDLLVGKLQAGRLRFPLSSRHVSSVSISNTIHPSFSARYRNLQ